MNNNRIKLCMTGTWLSSSNVGDNAIFLGILDSFKKHKLNPDITVFSSDPKRVQDLYSVKSFAPKKSPVSILISLLKCDYLLFTGGTPFYNNYWHMFYFTSIALIAFLARKKIVVYGISYRDIQNKKVEKFTKIILSISHIVGAREWNTFNKFKGLTNNNEKVMLFPDPAIQMIPSEKKVIQTLLDSFKLDWRRKTVGICLRDLLPNNEFQNHHYNKQFDPIIIKKTYQEIASFLEILVNNYDYNVLFLPMHINAPDDDRCAAREVYDLITVNNKTKRIYLLEKQLQPRDMKGVFKELHLLIGVRFHSLVLSSSVNTPVLNMGYAQKNHEIMKFINMEDYSVDIDKIDKEILLDKFGKLNADYTMKHDELQKRFMEINTIYYRVFSEVFPN